MTLNTIQSKAKSYNKSAPNTAMHKANEHVATMQKKLDGQEIKKEATRYVTRTRPTALYDELQWFEQALNVVHAELKDDADTGDIPQYSTFPNYATHHKTQKDKLHDIWMTLNTIQSKAKSYNKSAPNTAMKEALDETRRVESELEKKKKEIENMREDAKVARTQIKSYEVETKKEGASYSFPTGDKNRDDKTKMIMSVQNYDEISATTDVDKWPFTLLDPKDVSSSHGSCCETVNGVYTIARREALKQWKEVSRVQSQLEKKEQEIETMREDRREQVASMQKKVNEIDTKKGRIRDPPTGDMNLDDKTKLNMFVRKIHEIALGDQWQTELPDPTYVSSSQDSCYNAVKSVYLLARNEALKHRDDAEKINTLQSELVTKKKEVENMRKVHAQLEQGLMASKKEVDEVKLRLSALMGAKLQDGNPNIADLSDANRPTKIAEQFSQLYDDLWTDAFQVQMDRFKRTEEEAIARLLEMLMDTYKFCVKTSDTHSNTVLDEIMLIGKGGKHNSGQSSKRPQLTEIQRRHFQEMRKLTAVCTIGNLKNMFIDYAIKEDKLDTGEIQKAIPYLERCVELCWYMVLQNPPVHIQFEPNAQPGSPFRLEEYRFYNKSGKKLAYIVWPPLRLKKGGELLSKGVAQPMP